MDHFVMRRLLGKLETKMVVLDDMTNFLGIMPLGQICRIISLAQRHCVIIRW
jgi:hypothetical protein